MVNLSAQPPLAGDLHWHNATRLQCLSKEGDNPKALACNTERLTRKETIISANVRENSVRRKDQKVLKRIMASLYRVSLRGRKSIC